MANIGETVTDFILGGSKITENGDCSHLIKRCLLLGRKAMTNLDSILKSRDITLLIKVHLVKAMLFPVVIYGCESWTIKESRALKNWCFWPVVLEKTLESPWTARRSNQSILKEISPECSLEGLMLKLKHQYIGHLMRRANSLEKPWFWERLKAGREGDERGWAGWMALPTQWTWVWVNIGNWWCVLQSMAWQRLGHEWGAELNWTELNNNHSHGHCCLAEPYHVPGSVLKASHKLFLG